MPKKTKKEKIVAEYRKKLKLLQLSRVQTPSIVQLTPEKKTVIPHLPDKTDTVLSAEDKMIINNFTQDLKKSLLLIGSIVALEILLYFVSINTNLRLGH